MDDSKEKKSRMNISHEVSTTRPPTPQIPAAVTPKGVVALVPSPQATSNLPAKSPASSEEEIDWHDPAVLASRTASELDVRHEKVAAMRAALASGTYKVSSRKVAQSLIEYMLGKKP